MAGRRGPGKLPVILVVAGVVAVALALSQVGWLRWPSLFEPESKPPPREFPVLEPSRPTRLRIPSLKLEAPVSRVGLAEDGAIEVPPVNRHKEAGWFEKGPTPGQFGPAIIVGHADTSDGPSIFYNLPKLRPGALIEITRRDRTVAIFEVNSVERFNKGKLPTERVYGDFSRPGLRLITCGGRWVGGSTGYADNIIAFASLIATRDA